MSRVSAHISKAHIVEIAAIAAETPVLISAVLTAATAKIIGWELRLLAGSSLSSRAGRPVREPAARTAGRPGSGQ